MRILIDITHPAHLHFFRNAIFLLKEQGHDVKLTGRDKDILNELADQYGLELEMFGVFKPGIFNLAAELIGRWWRLYGIVRRWKPDRILSIAGTYSSPVGWVTGTPVHIFYDTENATLSNLLAYPFATCIHVPECYNKKIRWPHRRYAGYHELAYLDPNYFTPDPAVLDELKVRRDENYVLIRFVGWGAAHDIGHKGITRAMKQKAVEEFSRHARIFITSESPLPPDLEKYRFPLPSSRIHDAMAFAALLYGESATMASEAAILGTPAIYLDDEGRGYTDEQEKKYGLLFNYSESLDDQKASIEKGVELLTSGEAREKWKKRRGTLLRNTIDVTDYIIYVTTMKNSI
jgi:uncharacterized protein